MNGRTLVGRDAELQTLRTPLADPGSGPAAAVIEGEAGAGKTELWQRVLADAESHALVLTCRPAEVEAAMSYGGLDDLLSGALEHVADVLPGPQREACGRPCCCPRQAAVRSTTARSAPGR